MRTIRLITLFACLSTVSVIHCKAAELSDWKNLYFLESGATLIYPYNSMPTQFHTWLGQKCRNEMKQVHPNSPDIYRETLPFPKGFPPLRLKSGDSLCFFTSDGGGCHEFKISGGPFIRHGFYDFCEGPFFNISPSQNTGYGVVVPSSSGRSLSQNHPVRSWEEMKKLPKDIREWIQIKLEINNETEFRSQISKLEYIQDSFPMISTFKIESHHFLFLVTVKRDTDHRLTKSAVLTKKGLIDLEEVAANVEQDTMVRGIYDLDSDGNIELHIVHEYEGKYDRFLEWDGKTFGDVVQTR